MDEGMPPRFASEILTDQQRGMLELLGNPEVIVYRSISLLHEKGALLAGLPSIAPTHVTDHSCPVVMVLGQARMILPDGDMMSVDSSKIPD